MSMFAAIVGFFSWLKNQLPAIALAMFEYEEKRIEDQKVKNIDLQKNLELANNEIKNNENFNGKSDIDIVNQAIRDGGGTESDLISGESPTTDVPADPKKTDNLH